MDEKSHTLNINIKKSRTVRQEQLLETGATVTKKIQIYKTVLHTNESFFF